MIMTCQTLIQLRKSKLTTLTLPVKIDAITLNDIFDISEDSKIQTVTVNGKEFYAVTQHGDINSQSIDIPSFIGYPSPIAETNATFELSIPETNKKESRSPPLNLHIIFRISNHSL